MDNFLTRYRTASLQAVPVLQRFAEDELILTELCTRLHPYRCSAETFVYQKGEEDQAGAGKDAAAITQSHELISAHPILNNAPPPPSLCGIRRAPR